MQNEVLRIRSTVYEAIDTFFRADSFYEVSPPVLTPFSCEVACVGGSDLISVNYYGRTAFLSQSGQLYLEALAMQLEKVYCMGPAFRAESTSLATHLSEFWMCEAEMTNVTFIELVQNTNDLLTEIIDSVLKKNISDLESLGVSTALLRRSIANPFPRITYSDAINVLKNNGISVEWGEDINSYHEQILSRFFDNTPFFITLFPRKLSSFYKQTCKDDPEFTLSFDLIAPNGYGELVGGSLRENNVSKLEAALMLSGSNLETYKWYLDLISTNPKIHGGYGLGIERLITWLCNLNTIQEAIPFPRTEKMLWP